MKKNVSLDVNVYINKDVDIKNAIVRLYPLIIYYFIGFWIITTFWEFHKLLWSNVIRTSIDNIYFCKKEFGLIYNETFFLTSKGIIYRMDIQ